MSYSDDNPMKGTRIKDSDINWNIIVSPYMPLGITDIDSGKSGYYDGNTGETVSLEEWHRRNGHHGWVNMTKYHSLEERDRIIKELKDISK